VAQLVLKLIVQQVGLPDTMRCSVAVLMVGSFISGSREESAARLSLA